ncbi:hypothetical protein AB0J72_22670 [Dactylosporangium sp. NPDC049742]
MTRRVFGVLVWVFVVLVASSPVAAPVSGAEPAGPSRRRGSTT